MDVEVVDGPRNQGEQEAERARQDERGEEVHRTGATWQALRPVLESGPPEQEPADEVRDVLEVDEAHRVAKRRVVEGGHVPRKVGPEPERKGNERVR